MNYYKTISIIAIILLIISLSIIGTAMASSKDVLFPPRIADCPDFYVKNSNGECEDIKDINGSPNINGCRVNKFSHDKFNIPGLGKNSGICAKKKWARGCKVNWDGITNNPLVCYKEIS